MIYFIMMAATSGVEKINKVVLDLGNMLSTGSIQ